MECVDGKTVIAATTTEQSQPRSCCCLSDRRMMKFVIYLCNNLIDGQWNQTKASLFDSWKINGMPSEWPRVVASVTQWLLLVYCGLRFYTALKLLSHGMAVQYLNPLLYKLKNILIGRVIFNDY